MRFYVDTNVYIDYFADRTQSKFFTKVLTQGWTIIISSFVLKELQAYFPTNLAEPFWKTLNFEYVKVIPADFQRAKNIPTHIEDALHVAVALRTGADAIITRNLKDFINLEILVIHPDDI